MAEDKDNFYLKTAHPENQDYSGEYSVNGLRQIARDIKEYGSDLPLDLTVGTAIKESTGAKPGMKETNKKSPNYGKVLDMNIPYSRWKAERTLDSDVAAAKHPNYLARLGQAQEQLYAKEGEEKFTSPWVWQNRKETGRGFYKGNNQQIQDRIIGSALQQPALKDEDFAVPTAMSKLREGLQKFKGDKNLAAQWYNWDERNPRTQVKDRGARVMDLGRMAMESPAVRQILKEEGLLK
jgi:hypothetical protein